MTTGALTSQSQQSFAGKVDLGPPRQGALAGSAHAPKLIEQLYQRLRSRYYSQCTEQAYRHRVTRLIHFHNIRPPPEMEGPKINSFHETHLRQSRVPSAPATSSLKDYRVKSAVPVQQCRSFAAARAETLLAVRDAGGTQCDITLAYELQVTKSEEGLKNTLLIISF